MTQPIHLLLQTLLCAITLAALGSQPAHAQSNIRAKEFTQGELALLPVWCIDTQAGPYGSPEGGSGLNRSPKAGQWVGAMGTDFWHMHHYCWGLRDMRRMEGAGVTQADRVFLQGRAISEFSYVINNCATTMPLLPEVFLKIGEVYLMQGNLPAAQDAFERSRALKPDYWPAYDRWIGVLVGLKRYDTARALAEEGLKHSPNEPNLRARLASIRGAATARAGDKHKRAAKPSAASAPAV